MAGAESSIENSRGSLRSREGDPAAPVSREMMLGSRSSCLGYRMETGGVWRSDRDGGGRECGRRSPEVLGILNVALFVRRAPHPPLPPSCGTLFAGDAGTCDPGKGRKTMHIVAACVYIVCRQHHHPIMLIDISDKLAVNVYILGKVGL